MGQAEHGPDSPAWLVTTSREFAERVMSRIPHYIERLGEPNRTAATHAWRDYGEVVLAGSREEAARLSDAYAPEHLEVQADGLDWWLGRLRNYGSLFLGEETSVTYGDKSSGPESHPAHQGCGTLYRGLSVAKFIKTVTWQRMTRDANRAVGQTSARISRAEGMEGHAYAGDDRLAKYFPGERFDLA